MPLSHVTKTFAVVDAKIRPLLTDPEGGTATYGTAIDVPGIKSIVIEGSVETKTLRGDNRQLDANSVLTGITGTVTHSKLSLDAVGAMLNTAVVDTGTTPNQVASLPILGSAKPAYFMLDGISAAADPVQGNVKLSLAKCIVSSFPTLGFAEEDYQIPSFSFTVIPRLSDNQWITPSIHETAAVLTYA